MHQCDDLKRDGFCVVNSFLNQREVVTLCNEIDSLVPGEGVSLRNGRVFGARNLLQQLASLRRILRPDFLGSGELGRLIGDQTRPVRCIFLDKNPSANWTVVWHQDLTIAVRRKREVDGFKLWTTKAGVQHVQPPVLVRENMLALRIHLDLTGESNGALRVIPGSHRLGRLSPSLIKHLTATQAPRISPVNAGGAFLMKPLLLHSSLSCKNPVHRRVLHIEFSAESLPGGLEWYGN